MFILFSRCSAGTCKVKFETEDNALYHDKCHYSADSFRCIELGCKYTNTKWLTMKTHLWKSHGIDMEMFSCDQCGFKTNRYSFQCLQIRSIYVHKNKSLFLLITASRLNGWTHYLDFFNESTAERVLDIKLFQNSTP